MKMKKKKSYGTYIAVIVIVCAIAVVGLLGAYYGESANTRATRPEYCDDKGCIIPQVFSELPEYPKDMWQVQQLVEHGRIRTLENFTEGVPDENYYKQPEFYPTWKDVGVGFYTDIKPGFVFERSYLSVIGYGAFPGDQFITVEGSGRIDIVSFWHSNWGVVKWQGMGIGYSFPSYGESGETRVWQDPGIASKYLEIENEPNVLLLDPAFPAFNKGWSQKVKTIIYVKDGTPPGNYIIGVDGVDAPQELQDAWTKQYKLGYMPAGATGLGMGRPRLQIFLTVK